MDDDSDQDDSVELHVRPRRKNANLRPADILHQQKSTRRTRSQMVADEEAEKSAQASRQTELEGKRLKIAQVEAQLKSGKGRRVSQKAPRRKATRQHEHEETNVPSARSFLSSTLVNHDADLELEGMPVDLASQDSAASADDEIGARNENQLGEGGAITTRTTSPPRATSGSPPPMNSGCDISSNSTMSNAMPGHELENTVDRGNDGALNTQVRARRGRSGTKLDEWRNRSRSSTTITEGSSGSSMRRSNSTLSPGDSVSQVTSLVQPYRLRNDSPPTDVAAERIEPQTPSYSRGRTREPPASVTRQRGPALALSVDPPTVDVTPASPLPLTNRRQTTETTAAVDILSLKPVTGNTRKKSRSPSATRSDGRRARRTTVTKSDLPLGVGNNREWTHTFVPTVIECIGVEPNPWTHENVNSPELLTLIWKAIFPSNLQYVVQIDDPVQMIARQKIYEWRHGFGVDGIEVVKRYFRNPPFGSDPVKIAGYIDKVTDFEANYPFINLVPFPKAGEKRYPFRSKLISELLAGHLRRVQSSIATKADLVDTNSFPVGALMLSCLALLRALTFFQDGELEKHKDVKPVEFKNEAFAAEQTQFFKLSIEGLKARSWRSIMDDAIETMEDISQRKKRAGAKLSVAPSSAVRVVEDDGSSSSDDASGN